MNDSQKLLKEISKATQMSLGALDALIPEVKSSPIKETLKSQRQTYASYNHRVNDAMKSAGIRPDPTGIGQRLNQMNIKMQTKMNSSSERIASMMIQGSDMGIIALQRARNHTPTAHRSVKYLADEIIRFEQNTIDAYKPYL